MWRVGLLALLVFFTSAAPEAERVQHLPTKSGTPPFDSVMYSGYADLTSGKRLHYMFVPSQNAPATDPVFLWMNGGPGCSSLLGFFYETGPYVFYEEGDTELIKNPYAWNQKANMIYLEAPAGVGFSVVKDDSQLTTGDKITAEDNYEALQTFFKKYSEYARNDFYILAESYGGIYGPTLAYLIDQGNTEKTAPYIPLKGWVSMNGVVNPKVEIDNAYPDFSWSHFLSGQETRDKYENNCNNPNGDANLCEVAKSEVLALMQGINIYDIYRTCVAPPAGMSYEPKHNLQTRYARWSLLGQMAQKTQATTNIVPGCADASGIFKLLHDESIIDALHIDSQAFKWDMCCDELKYNLYNWNGGSFWVYQKLVQENPGKYHVLLLTGDTDMAVPLTGTRVWLKQLNQPVDVRYKQWHYDGQVAGFYEVYSGDLTLATVKGTGHMSTQWKRPQAKYVFDKWLARELH